MTVFFYVNLFLFSSIIIFTYLIFNKFKITTYNYRKKEVVKSLGISLAIYYFLVYLLTLFIGIKKEFLFITIIAVILGLAGFADDIFGSPEFKGIKGHFKALTQGKITTGVVKAVTGIGIGLMIAYMLGGSAFVIFFKTLTFAFCVNFFNLLDLRPGRAIKGYIFINLIFIVFMMYKNIIFPVFPVIVFIFPVLILFYYDLKEIALIGDAGSNILGGLIGYSVILLPDLLISVILTMLILLHLISEFFSFTDIIEKNSFLRWFDNLGRLR